MKVNLFNRLEFYKVMKYYSKKHFKKGNKSKDIPI